MQTVLNYNPRPAHDHDRSGRVYLVWPSAAWRVVAPLSTDRRINILQKAVLGLCRSGSYSVSEIAAILRLHPRLVETIGMELVGFGWVDSETWRPNVRGLDLLKEEESAMESLVTGWVFQNPWTGDLWPFFSRQLQLQDTRPSADSKRLTLLIDTAKGVRKIPAWELEPLSGSSQPSSEAVLIAVKRFRRREKLKGFMRLAATALDLPDFENQPELVSRIVLISEQPESVGLVTFGYFPTCGGLAPQICDPFGFGCPEEMWRHLQRLSQQDERAAAAQRELLQYARVENAQALEEQLNQQLQTAEAEIIACLSLDIKTSPGVFKHLLAAQNYMSLAVATAGDAESHLATVMHSCRKTLEALLKEVARRSPLRDAYKLLTQYPVQDQITLEKIAAELGFTSPLPPRLVRTMYAREFLNAARKICRDLEAIFSLARAVVVTLLASKLDAKHPFRAAAARNPKLLHELVRLIELGNAGSHDDSHEEVPKPLTVAEAEELLQLTLHVTSCLLELPFHSQGSK